jgi:hypothetical protein
MKIFWQVAALAAISSAYGGAGKKDDWADYQSGARKELEAINARIGAMAVSARKEGVESRRKIELYVSGLRSQAADVEGDLRRLKNARKRDRDALRARIDAGLRKLEKGAPNHTGA